MLLSDKEEAERLEGGHEPTQLNIEPT